MKIYHDNLEKAYLNRIYGKSVYPFMKSKQQVVTYTPFHKLCVKDRHGKTLLRVKISESEYLNNEDFYNLMLCFRCDTINEYEDCLSSYSNGWKDLKELLLDYYDIDEITSIDFITFSMVSIKIICGVHYYSFRLPALPINILRPILDNIYSINYISNRYLVELLIDAITDCIERMEYYEQEIAKSKN